jgi:HAD superfamily hydrolase (TIGR01549 family)
MNKANKVKAIYFDVDDTLFSTNTFHTTAIHKAMNEILKMLRNQFKLPLPINKTEAKIIVDETYNDFKVGHRELFKLVLRRLNFQYGANLDEMTMAILEAKAIHIYDKDTHLNLEKDNDVINVLFELKDRGYELGIITNGSGLWQAFKYNKLDLYEHFKPKNVFISEVVGIKKPNPQIFKTVMKKSNLEDYFAIYVGDDPCNDIKAASMARMITVYVKTRDGENKNSKVTTKPCFVVNRLNNLPNIIDRRKCRAFVKPNSCKHRQCPFFKKNDMQ